MVINIAIHKTFSIYDLLNKLFIATKQYQYFNVLISVKAYLDKKVKR